MWHDSGSNPDHGILSWARERKRDTLYVIKLFFNCENANIPIEDPRLIFRGIFAFLRTTIKPGLSEFDDSINLKEMNAIKRYEKTALNHLTFYQKKCRGLFYINIILRSTRNNPPIVPFINSASNIVEAQSFYYCH